MYRDDVRDLFVQKKEADRSLLWNFVTIYTKMKIFFPTLEKERKDLAQLVQLYMQTEKNENEVLRDIRKYYGKVDDHEGIDEMLEEFDEMFENIYLHCDKTFQSYEDVFYEYGSFWNLIMAKIRAAKKAIPLEPEPGVRRWMKHMPIRFPIFDEEYKVRMKEKVRTLPEPEKEEF